jgi:hypothetical protein
MTRKASSFGKFPALPMAALLLIAATVSAQDKPGVSTPAANIPPVAATATAMNAFDTVADQALLAMKNRAVELNVKGVATVSYSEGDSVQSWSSKMAVVGNLKTGPSTSDPNGANLLAIAYSKAAEMADTLKASGSGIRPPMKGEFGWQGGVVARGKTGYLIVAFSGGASAQDVKISQAGLEVLARFL